MAAKSAKTGAVRIEKALKDIEVIQAFIADTNFYRRFFNWVWQAYGSKYANTYKNYYSNYSRYSSFYCVSICFNWSRARIPDWLKRWPDPELNWERKDFQF